MKLTIKSLKQVPYEVEVESDQLLVKDLKEEVEKKHGFDKTTLKLLFNGSVLDDAKKLADCNIKEGCVVVMMSSKVKVANVPAKEEVKAEEKVEGSNTTSTSQSQNQQQSNQQSNTQTRPQRPAADYTAQLKELQDMGFPKPESEAAIKAAKGNLNLAVEFLYNGIPEGMNIPEGEAEGGEEVDPNSPQGLLKNVASVVKVLCYNNPSQLQNILLTLQQSSPELIALIRENEDEFKTLIQQPITDEDLRAFQAFQGRAQGEGGSGGRGAGGTGGAGGRGRDNVIRLTKDEFDAVNRLKELGFSEHEAVQAFFACDKNEELAASFLIDNKMREQEQELYIDCKLI
jgi:UV excision repair protein RAD23